MKAITALILVSMLISGCSFFGIRSGYEQPQYEIVDHIGESVEIRAYGPRLAAEARLENTDNSEGRNSSFKLLFDYISGGNRAGASISMTSPVETVESSKKIAMTVPVETAGAGKRDVYMRFFLPRNYNREAVPKPLDPRVRIINVPAQTIAVLRFSGFSCEKSVSKKKSDLINTLDGTVWRPVSKPVAYFYDPPWTLPFLRRNEAAVAVAR